MRNWKTYGIETPYVGTNKIVKLIVSINFVELIIIAVNAYTQAKINGNN